MSTDVTPEQILQVLRENEIVGDADSLAPDTDLYLAGLDSMALMQLLLQIELVLGMQIQPGEITRERFSTAEHLAAFLNGRSEREA